jgi:hypothetical protein
VELASVAVSLEVKVAVDSLSLTSTLAAKLTATTSLSLADPQGTEMMAIDQPTRSEHVKGRDRPKRQNCFVTSRVSVPTSTSPTVKERVNEDARMLPKFDSTYQYTRSCDDGSQPTSAKGSRPTRLT